MWHHRLQRRIRFSYWNELCVAENKGRRKPSFCHSPFRSETVGFTTSSNGSLPMRG